MSIAPNTPGAAPAVLVNPLDAALAGLAASRARLRAELCPPPGADADPLDADGQPQASAWPRSLTALWRRARHTLRAWPAADMAAGLLQDWWQRHPWRSNGEALVETARHGVLPLVRRHPLSMLLGAAALGALLVAARAWRWPVLRPAAPPSARGLGRWLASQLASPAVQTALVSALMLAVKQWSAPAQAAAAPPMPAGPAPTAPTG